MENINIYDPIAFIFALDANGLAHIILIANDFNFEHLHGLSSNIKIPCIRFKGFL